MEALLIQSSKRLMVKSADMKNTQNIVLKLSTPGGQLFPKLSLAMQLPEKSVQPSLGAHVKLESMLFYLSTLYLPHSLRTLLHNGVNFRCLCIAKHFSLKFINYHLPRINFVPKNCIVEDQNRFALINITHNWEALKLEPVVNKKTEKRTQVLSKSN